MASDMLTSEVAAVLQPAERAWSLTVLLVGPAGRLSMGLQNRHCQVMHVTDQQIAEYLKAGQFHDAMVLVRGDVGSHISPGTVTLLRLLHVPVMVLGGSIGEIDLPEWLCDTPDGTAGAEEIIGRAAMLVRMARHARRMRAKVRRLKRFGRHLQDSYEQIDNELLLASQLQRDFLPKQLPQLPGLAFAAMMRPYSWVSGDIYDVFRIDEDHVGLYVADAVGHGVAAGLLTMFIKQALIAKRVTGHDYHILEPVEVLRELNESIASHDLPNCQYVTICYVVINLRTGMAKVSRAAHPAPLLVERDGTIQSINSSPGCVIGVFPDQEFSQTEVELQSGQKLLVFSDGLEEAFGQSPLKRNRWLKIVYHCAGRDIHALFEKLEKTLDRTRGSLHPEDDITAVGVEVR